jgi:hypothetical protein
VVLDFKIVHGAVYSVAFALSIEMVSPLTGLRCEKKLEGRMSLKLS